MKKTFITTTIVTACILAVSAQPRFPVYGEEATREQSPAPDQIECIAETPNISTDIGTARFISAKTWSVGNQEWSDAVTATKCQKERFYGWSSNQYNADCKKNPSYGDLFSWCAVKLFGNQLCPSPWRVPTVDDFIALDIALGGNGEGIAEKEITITEDEISGYGRVPKTTTTKIILGDEYINSWGGAYGGSSNDSGVARQGSEAFYWSQSVGGFTRSGVAGRSLYLQRGGDFRYGVNPQKAEFPGYGFTLRCVRDSN